MATNNEVQKVIVHYNDIYKVSPWRDVTQLARRAAVEL